MYNFVLKPVGILHEEELAKSKLLLYHSKQHLPTLTLNLHAMKTLLFVLSILLSAGTYGQKANAYQALQGKWRSLDDRSNILWFDKNHRKEIAAGMKEWDDEVFVLSNACKNATDKESESPPETDKYISVAGSDMCWYIEKLTPTALVLSYIGRGNTLSYKRVVPVTRKKR